LKSAFIFGHSGNLQDALGPGWSVEDGYAWAVGAESRLTLALPGDDTTYVLRFVVHPLINPGVRDSQRAIFKVGDAILARFAIAERQAVEIPLPPALTSGVRSLELTVEHPDAMRPADFQASSDLRWLTLCFHSAGLIGADEASPAGDGPNLPVVLVAGGIVARQLAGIASALPNFRGRAAFRYVDTATDIGSAEPGWAMGAVSGAAACWLQMETGRASTIEGLGSVLLPGTAIRRFGVPHMRALWPFLSADARAVPEGDLYPSARYRFGDRIAAGIRAAGMSDDALFALYEAAGARDMPDLDALLAADVADWERLDGQSDIALAAFLKNNFRVERLFLAPSVPGPALLRALAERLLAFPLPGGDVPAADLDTVMEGYMGPREELPVHPAVASHFGLAWWHPDLSYRWFGNRLPFRDYMLGYMRWAAWRP